MIVAGHAGNIAPRRGNKYRAKKATVDGIGFDSIKESKRYLQLRLLERAGRIKDLELKPRYELEVSGVKIGRYTGDFRYLELQAHGTWILVVEDVKGYSRHARDYPLRMKLMKAIHGIEVRQT